MPRRYLKDPVTQEEYLAWVSPNAVHYDLEEMELLLPWFYHMREGDYPAEPSGGYVEGKRKGILSHAYYEAACQVAAEIDERLKRTKLDRFLVEAFYCKDDWSDDILYADDADAYKLKYIAKQLDMKVSEVERRIKSAVGYIASGKCRRWVNCIDCPEYQRCAAKQKQYEENPNKQPPPAKFTKNLLGISYGYWKRSRSQAIMAERR